MTRSNGLPAAGELSAFAMNRQRALDLDAASSALRALPDSFVDIPQSFVVRKGDGAKRARCSGSPPRCAHPVS